MNKKCMKIIAAAALAGAVAAGSAGLAACAGVKVREYEGEYSHVNTYAPQAPYYGIKVKVSVQSDKKGDRIKSVQVVESDYTEVTDSWADKALWNDGLNNLLLSYRARYVADVLAETVAVDENAAPQSVTDSGLMITGATLGSGRLLLAVQDALADAASELGYTVHTGEYSYPNPYAPATKYGIRVKVVVKDGVIAAVKNDPSAGYIEVTDSWKDKALWNDGLSGLLAAYRGKRTEDVLAATVTVDGDKAPQTVSDSSLVIAGATMGSGRLLLAVQNALKS